MTTKEIKVLVNKETTFKVGDKVIYHGHEMVITDIYGKRADLRYKDVEVAGIKITSLKKA